MRRKFIIVIVVFLTAIYSYGQQDTLKNIRSYNLFSIGDTTVVIYLNKHKTLEERYKYFYFQTISESQLDITKNDIAEHEPVIIASRSGNRAQNLEILFEVAILNGGYRFDLGNYKNLFADITIRILTSTLNAYISGKEERDVESIRIIGNISGIADANPIGNTQYNGEFGNISSQKYRDKSVVPNTVKYMNISPNSNITNLQLAFLRAYNALQVINKDMLHHSVVQEQNIEIIAIDELIETGYDWRKIVIKITVENFYLNDFNALDEEVQNDVVRIVNLN